MIAVDAARLSAMENLPAGSTMDAFIGGFGHALEILEFSVDHVSADIGVDPRAGLEGEAGGVVKNRRGVVGHGDKRRSR